MKVEVLEEAGYQWAMEGIALSYLEDVERMPKVALGLVKKGEPHCKFLRQMKVWVRITGPWYWWKHMQTYNVGADWPDFQSSSTMHKLLSRKLTQDDFEHSIVGVVLNTVNAFIAQGNLELASLHLPGGFLYTRILCMNYSAIRNVVRQRHDHRLPEWHTFIDLFLPQLQHPEFLQDLRY